MAGKLEDLISKLKNLQTLVKEVVGNFIQDNEQDILDLNRAQMTVLGVDANDDQLGEYAPVSIWGDPSRNIPGRLAKGLQVDFIDLRYTGEFQDKMKINKKEESEQNLRYEFDSTDPKWEHGEDGNRSLQAQWPDALGLDPDNEDRLTRMLTGNVEFNVDNYFESERPSKIRQRA